MGNLAIETRNYSPENFFAGDFPTVPETGVAASDIEKHTPITKNDTGLIVPVTAENIDKLVGISADAAKADEPVVYYMTGEYFTTAINVPEGIEEEALKEACRKNSIFLRD